jgi:hypothetical protein
MRRRKVKDRERDRDRETERERESSVLGDNVQNEGFRARVKAVILARFDGC